MPTELVALPRASVNLRRSDLLSEDIALCSQTMCVDVWTSSFVHRGAIFSSLSERRKDLFQADFEALVYDCGASVQALEHRLIFGRRT